MPLYTDRSSLACAYDQKYKQAFYFRYREWLYRPFIHALMRKAGLKLGSTILDVGCGQGFFTGAFASLGLQSVGVDISEEGIRSAKKLYGSSGAAFEVADVLLLNPERQYDCVFVRGLSLYNSPDFRNARSTTNTLLTYVKPGGTLIFDYHSTLSPTNKSESWIYHSLADVREHFLLYPGSKIYFSLRVESLLLGRWSLCALDTFVAAVVSRVSGVGGELVVLVPKAAFQSNKRLFSDEQPVAGEIKIQAPLERRP